ncbi:MAG: argininosuccinate synthase domain-containing protein, partial [Pseudomonadota bacterium]
ARPIISKACLEVAREVGAEAFAHGATGKGNDQCRFQLAAEALDPNVKIIAPWRIKSFRDKFPGRTELIDYCDIKKIPVKASAAKPYSSDENCLHISYEAGELEEVDNCGVAVPDFGMGVSPQEAPDRATTIEIAFKAGDAVGIDGEALSPATLLTRLNDLGRDNGIGRLDLVENRFVGM